MTRRSLTSSPDLASGASPTRRTGGTRKEISDRVKFVVSGREVEGWALNVSRGGLRAIVDEPIELGAEVEVSISEGPARASRIVWIQEEPDGAIVGVEFRDGEGSVPPAPGSLPKTGDGSEPR